MNDLIKKIKERGGDSLPLPKPAGSYLPYLISGKYLFISGQLPWGDNGEIGWSGPIDEGKIEYGIEAAERCGLYIVKTALLAVDQEATRLTRVVKLGGFVQSAESFTQHPKVINGASDLIRSLFGESGTHVRFAVGVNTLPLNASVEVEALLEID